MFGLLINYMSDTEMLARKILSMHVHKHPADPPFENQYNKSLTSNDQNNQ